VLAAHLVLVHVLAVFWLVAGIVGRFVALSTAGRATDLASLRTLVGLGGLFERAFVQSATLVVFLTGLLAAWLRGWPILGALQGASVNWVLAAIIVYLTIIPVIVFVMVPKGRALQTALAEAGAQGQVTPALKAAMADPVVGVARTYEFLMVVVLAWLMIAHPF